jgi:hypothetical protein
MSSASERPASLVVSILIALAIPIGASVLACIAPAAAAPPAFREMGAAMPRFTVDRWINSPPLQPEGLRGKVVLVEPAEKVTRQTAARL